MTAVKSIIESLRPRKHVPVEQVADTKLDEALQRLAEATRSNTEMCERVKRRQSSGRLKVVSVPSTGADAE